MKTIVILGAGYAGLRAAKKLVHAKLDARIVLVNKNPYHYEATQLHQVAAGTKEPEDITFDIRDVEPQKVEVLIDEVTEIDRAAHKVLLKDHEPLAYDYLLNALGFESETFGIKGAEENGWPLVDVDTALAARRRLESMLARYNTSHDENDLHIVVCGAGFTSIEYLGELVWRLPRLVKEYGLPEEKIRIDCIEAAPKILPMFEPKLAQWAVKYLEGHGVNFHVSTPITEVKPDALVSNGTEYKANTVIWATGVRGSEVIAKSGYDQKRNRVIVKDDLSVEGNPNEFLIGDVSAVPNPAADGRPYPGTGQISIVQADCAAANVVARIKGKPTKKFVYKSLGTVCSLGPHCGIAELDAFGHMKLKGAVVQILKKIVNDRSVLEMTDIKTMLESN